MRGPVVARRLGWSLWAFTIMTLTLSLFLASLNEPTSSFWNMALISALGLAFSTVGALVASRRPENPIGWLFLWGALIWILGEFTLEYGVYALITAPGSLPAAEWMVWFGGWARGMGWFIIVMFLLLLFPDGQLPSSRWRPVLWASVGFIVLFTVVVLLSPVSEDFRLSFVRNPLGVDFQIINPLSEVMYLAMPLLLGACGAAVIVRFRRSRGDERQQLKWFAYAVGVMVGVFAVWFLLVVLGFVPAGAPLFTVPLLGLPVAAGVAILKYRLYDIDLLINRTLVYGSLTTILILFYVSCVIGLQYVLRTLTGQESQLAIVASTLAVATLFNPLRQRIQSFIDRRFYRRKYDARKTLESFSSKLRDETDLKALNQELVGAVRETMQPAYVSLWLRPSNGLDKRRKEEHSR